MKALIDGDSLLYKAGFTFEEKFDWNELEVELGKSQPQYDYDTDLVAAKNAVDALIEAILFHTGTYEVEIWLSSPSNFRFTVDPTYKSNRSNSRKPLLYQELLAYLTKKYNVYTAEGYEADDKVVYLKTTYPDDYFLCAIDKDVLYQTEGTHYNYHTSSMITVTKEEADRFAYYQCLVGDQVDGYPGCPGIGKVKATKLLDESTDYWKTVVDTYKSKGLTEADALKQMRLANMHQLHNNIIILWSPS